MVAAGEQRLGDVTADEAGRAGYEDPSIHQQLFPYLEHAMTLRAKPTRWHSGSNGQETVRMAGLTRLVEW